MRDMIKNDEWGIEDFFDDLFRPMQFEKRAMSMKTDVKEDENQYELDIDMPGFKKEEINVTLKNGYLNVSAKSEHKDEHVEKGTKNYIRRERSQIASRSYYVGDKIKEENIKAKYDNGVLSLVVPKEKPKEITTHKINIDWHKIKSTKNQWILCSLIFFVDNILHSLYYSNFAIRVRSPDIVGALDNLLAFSL